MLFSFVSDFSPAGDQPQAIAALIDSLSRGERNQVLLGVTGSGKTFSMAKVIASQGKPALIMAPNKTLATRSLLERRDVIIVASVSCIYGIGSVETYSQMVVALEKGQRIKRDELLRQFISLRYKRNDIDFYRGMFRVRGDTVEIFPSHYEDRAWRLSFFGDEIEEISEVDPLTGAIVSRLPSIKVYANSHYVTPGPTLQQATQGIKKELKERLEDFRQEGKLLEAQRLEQRTKFDLEMIAATGMCAGIENYSRFLTGRAPGEPPPTLFEYLPKDALLFVDESHVSVPQIGGMYKGDAVRKTTLSEFGFRLPSCKDNRPLKFEEWETMRPQTIFVSATPGPWELTQTHGVFVEQVIRPTGLMDPVCLVRPAATQVEDLIQECQSVAKKGSRVLVTTLTKRMAEALTDYLSEAGLKVKYIHSDIDTMERIEIIRDLRLGIFDVLIGINLLREGLDIPESGLVAILDADKEGYLRSKTSLIQTIGRAARNVDGRAILYADRITDSMKIALEETERRRERQQAYNATHGITPETIKKSIHRILESVYEKDHTTVLIKEDPYIKLSSAKRKAYKNKLEKDMFSAASNLEFEEAARLRDELKAIEEKDLTLLGTTDLPTNSCNVV